MTLGHGPFWEWVEEVGLLLCFCYRTVGVQRDGSLIFSSVITFQMEFSLGYVCSFQIHGLPLSLSFCDSMIFSFCYIFTGISVRRYIEKHELGLLFKCHSKPEDSFIFQYFICPLLLYDDESPLNSMAYNNNKLFLLTCSSIGHQLVQAGFGWETLLVSLTGLSSLLQIGLRSALFMFIIECELRYLEKHFLW